MIQEFLTYEAKVKNLRPNTVKAYAEDLKDFAQWLQITKRAHRFGEVHRRDVEAYLSDMHDAEKKPATIRRHLAAIRCLYNYAIKQEYTKTNPARFVEAPKRARALPSTIKAEAIEDYCDDARHPLALRCMIALLYETGLRISEACDIETRDVDPLNRSIRVYEGKGLTQRHVFYGERTRRLMNAYLGFRRGKIFQGADACQREIRYQIWRALNKYVEGDRQASPHIIRHTYAMKMLNQGMPLSSLQTILGHRRPETTETYARATMATTKRDYERAISARA